MSNDKLLQDVSDYYTQKVKEHGASPRGVDWNSEESQFLRFEKLSQVFNTQEGFSVLDYGCGTGAYIKFLKQKKYNSVYHGFDISKEMIGTARQIYPEDAQSFITEVEAGKFDYVIASGIFNVRLQHNENDWKEYILDTLEKMNSLSEKGFSFNILTLYSDIEKRRSDLFYADPLYYFDLCKKKYSRFVTLIHDYPLYEFTILVRKDV